MTDKTKITLSIAKFFGMIIAVAGFLIIILGWAGGIEYKVNENCKKIELLEGLQREVIEQGTDIKWIRSRLEEE